MTAPIDGPFYFALVDEDDDVFGVEHHRMDWYIFSSHIQLAEGEKPKLNLQIENPRIGLLSTEVKQWCWFAFDKSFFTNDTSDGIVPLFFGRILGIPTDIQDEVINVTFNAWPSDYFDQLQKITESLKQLPSYDPIWFDVTQRDDPSTVFEAQSKVVCVDPVTNIVTAEDILDASDGNIDLTESDHFYTSLKVSPGAVPKSAVHVDATVSWTQTGRGYLDMGYNTIFSYSGDGILSEWPKPLSSLAPGLTVFSSYAIDTHGVNSAVTTSWSVTFNNKDKHHEDGDTLSQTVSQTRPQLIAGLSSIISFSYQAGFLDPSATDGDGDPSPTNIPMSYQSSTSYAALYRVDTSLIVEYNAARPHTERVIFTLQADIQPTTFDPLVTEDSETLTLSSADVGIPIVNLLNWTTISGTHVDEGVLIFPDNPSLPGGRSAQIAVNPGTAGDVQPEFSDVPGAETSDGTDGLVWASIGAAQPPEQAADWSGMALVNAGTMILPSRPIYITYTNFVMGGLLQFPPVATSISEGIILQMPDGTFSVCTQGGSIGLGTETAVLESLGPTLPTGTIYFIAKNDGITGARYIIPRFDNTLHHVTIDGTVEWVCVGPADLPVGGVPGNVNSFSYFSTDRGKQSLEHLILRARARLRYASRCVTSTFECDYVKGTEFSLRKTATLHDHRLPGGIVAGKITGVDLVASNGSFTCQCTIQSSVGKDTVIEAVQGTSDYIDDDYYDGDYFEEDGTVVLLPDLSDVGYEPLRAIPDSDGISFPLTKSMIVVSEEIRSEGDQVGAVHAAFANMQSAQKLSQLSWSVEAIKEAEIFSSNNLGKLLQQNPIWYELVMKPLNGGGSFNRAYYPTVTKLGLPKMIDLESESTT